MAWLLYVRYYLVAKDRKRALILSMKDNVTSQLPRDQIKVPWGTLFIKPAFWFVFKQSHFAPSSDALLCRAVVVGHFCNNNAYFILLSWLPTYFQENFPGEKVSLCTLCWPFLFIVSAVPPGMGFQCGALDGGHPHPVVCRLGG
jgi:ACS family sodium-dependent inorganic phosphate cotransporter-like MFS transporter 9